MAALFLFSKDFRKAFKVPIDYSSFELYLFTKNDTFKHYLLLASV